MIDSLRYDDESPWPLEADGGGATLALRHPAFDNRFAPHWSASANGGTPGASNDDVFDTTIDACQLRNPDDILFRRGDCNADGNVDIADAVCTLVWLFSAQAEPRCLASLDVDGANAVNITDPIYLLAHLFSGGPAPVAPYASCGVAEDEAVGCVSSQASCE